MQSYLTICGHNNQGKSLCTAYFSNKHFSIIRSLSALHCGRGPKKVTLKVWSPSIKFKIQPRGRGIFKRLCFSLIPLFFSYLLVSSLLSIFELGDEVCRGSQMLRILKKRFLLEFCYLSTDTSGGMVPWHIVFHQIYKKKDNSTLLIPQTFDLL